MMTHRCDKCGKEMKEFLDGYVYLRYTRNKNQKNKATMTDYCDDCLMGFIKAVEAFDEDFFRR